MWQYLRWLREYLKLRHVPAGETCGGGGIPNLCEPDAVEGICGDGVLDAGEECDGTVFATGYGACPAGTTGTVTCESDCNVNTSGCIRQCLLQTPRNYFVGLALIISTMQLTPQTAPW